MNKRKVKIFIDEIKQKSYIFVNKNTDEMLQLRNQMFSKILNDITKKVILKFNIRKQMWDSCFDTDNKQWTYSLRTINFIKNNPSIK